MKCDTCRRESPEVSRVVIYVGYNRLNAKPIYNCPDCFSRKEETKSYAKSSKGEGSCQPK